MNAAVDTQAHDPSTHRRDIETFLGGLFVPSGQFLEIRCVTPDVLGAKSWFCGSVTAATNVAQQRSGQANVYVGACPRSEKHGTKDVVRVATAAWADLDFHQLDPRDRPRAEMLAHERIRSIDRRPTILVHTGNGLQAWWLYTEPVGISEAWPVGRFEAINRGIAQSLGGDAVHDLARVLRVPGTWNVPDAKKRARGCVPVVAKLLWVDGPSYRPDELADLQLDSEPTRPRATPPSGRALGLCVELDPVVIDAFIQSLDALDGNHPLVRTWYGKRPLLDDSRSGWDMALANQLVRAGVRDEYIAMILRSFPLGRGSDATEDYLARTIAKAQDATWRSW